MNVAINELEQLVSIKQVEKGLACHCFCFECNESVVAKKGEKNEHHFAHSSNKESCNISPESILHKFAKQVIMEEQSIVLPPLPNNDEMKANTWRFDRLVEEQAIGPIQPDLVASIDNDTLLIEIAVTSFVDKEKLDFIKQLSFKTVEIDLRELLSRSIDIPSEEARQFILEQVHNKKWLYPETIEPKKLSLDSLSTPNMSCINSEQINSYQDVQQSVPKKNYVKYRFTINKVWVDTWVFSDGGVSVKAVSYNPEIVALLKKWSREGGGRYTPKFKAWKYFNPFAHTVLQRLQAMDSTPKS